MSLVLSLPRPYFTKTPKKLQFLGEIVQNSMLSLV